MITQLESKSPKVIGFKLSEKLRDADYDVFVPAAEAAIAASGKVRMLVQCEDFHGWDLPGAWDDLKFGLRHWMHFERIAVVGEERWEHWMARLWKPFTTATVKYFPMSEAAAAWAWLLDGA